MTQWVAWVYVYSKSGPRPWRTDGLSPWTGVDFESAMTWEWYPEECVEAGW